MSTPKVKVAVEEAVATITLDDPATLNALSLEMAAGLHEAAAEIAMPGSGVRAVILTGQGRGFCSGANLQASPARDGPPDEAVDLGAGLERFHNPMMTALRDLPVPLVTAVNGAAAGIGCSLALIGDLIVAGEGAYFLQAFRRIGLVPDGGSTWLLPRMVGRARAMEMALLGEKIAAATALDWGLVNRVVPDAEVAGAARALALRLAQGPASLGLTRRLIHRAETAHWGDQLDAERRAQKEAGATSDFVEGVQAFLQKRPAVFTGR